MIDKYTAVANTNENGLVKGKKYIIESKHTGTVDVYDTNGNYLLWHRADNFDNWVVINN